jgi:nucleotide-binding universal stress UspA family protein
MRILIPVDGSSFSKSAVDFVASRTTLIQHQPEVELLNVQYPVSARVGRAAGKEVVASYQASEANKVFKPCLATFKRAGLTAQSKYVVGSPGSTVGQIAAEDAADLIVMGSHGHTGFRSALFGSVTHAVLASCDTPLLVLRDGALPKKDSLRIGMALDGSKYGVAAARFVARHRDLFGAAPAVTLLHVVPDLLNLVVPGYFGGRPLQMAEPGQVQAMQVAAFDRAVATPNALLKAAGLQVKEVRLTGNNPGDEIAAYVKKNKLDILVLGSQGCGALRSVTMGSVSTRVAAKCRHPLLLIRLA